MILDIWGNMGVMLMSGCLMGALIADRGFKTQENMISSRRIIGGLRIIHAIIKRANQNGEFKDIDKECFRDIIGFIKQDLDRIRGM